MCKACEMLGLNNGGFQSGLIPSQEALFEIMETPKEKATLNAINAIEEANSQLMGLATMIQENAKRIEVLASSMRDEPGPLYFKEQG